MKFEFEKKSGSKLEKVTNEEIAQSERELGFSFSKGLVRFYHECGCGKIGRSTNNVNRPMDPISVCDFRLRQGDFEFYPDIELYDDYEDKKLIFCREKKVARSLIHKGRNIYERSAY